MFDDSDLHPPPPAYSEQEFDRKISTALQESLTISHPEDGLDEWEVWDEDLFQTRAGQLGGPTSVGSSQSTATSPRSVAPLRVHKKNPSNPSNTISSKQKPSWYDEAGLGESSSSPSVQAIFSPSGPSNRASDDTSPSAKPRPSWYDAANQPEPVAGSSGGAAPSGPNAATSSPSTSALRPSTPPASYQSQDHQHPHPSQPHRPLPSPSSPQGPRPPDAINISVEADEDEDEDHSVPPPPFTPVGPSLDGPPFEEVATLSYSGPDSSSPSPLASPDNPSTSLPPMSPPLHHPAPQEPSPPASLVSGPRAPSRTSVTSDYQFRPSVHQSSSPSPPAQTSLPPRARPSSAARHAPPVRAPHIDFNPYVAYGKREERLARSQPVPDFDPTAFYNSAVSSHISASHFPTAQRYQRPQTMEGRQFSGGYNQPPPPLQAQRPGYNQWDPQPTVPAQYAPQYHTQQANLYAQAYPGGGMVNQGMKPDSWDTQSQSFPGRYC